MLNSEVLAGDQVIPGGCDHIYELGMYWHQLVYSNQGQLYSFQAPQLLLVAIKQTSSQLFASDITMS